MIPKKDFATYNIKQIQNNPYIHLFENLINNRQENNTQEYILSNNIIEEVTSNNWAAAFEISPTENGGAIIVVSKEYSWDNLSGILNTYDGLLSSGFGESLLEKYDIE